MTDTTRNHPRSGAALMRERQRCPASDMGLDPTTLTPLPPRSALEIAAGHATALAGADDLLPRRDLIAFTAALAAVSQAESASRTATALESIAEALAALARAAA